MYYALCLFCLLYTSRTEEQKETLSYLETELEISPIDNPYDYVKELQSRFDNSGIEYSLSLIHI